MAAIGLLRGAPPSKRLSRRQRLEKELRKRESEKLNAPKGSFEIAARAMQESNWPEFIHYTWWEFRVEGPADEFNGDFLRESAASGVAMWETIADGRAERWPVSFQWWRLVPREEAQVLAARLHACCATLPFRPLVGAVLPPFGELQGGAEWIGPDIRTQANRRGVVKEGAQIYRPHEIESVVWSFVNAIRLCVSPPSGEGLVLFWRITQIEETATGRQSIAARWWDERSARATFDKKDRAALLGAFNREIERQIARQLDREGPENPDCKGEVFEGNKPRTTLFAAWNADEVGALQWLLQRPIVSAAAPLAGADGDVEVVLTADGVAALLRAAEAAIQTPQDAIEAELRADPGLKDAEEHELFEIAEALIEEVAPAVVKLLQKAAIKNDPVTFVGCIHG